MRKMATALRSSLAPSARRKWTAEEAMVMDAEEEPDRRLHLRDRPVPALP